MRTGGVGGISDQERASARPGRECCDIKRIGDRDVVGSFQDARDRIVPAGMEVEQVPPYCVPIHGTEGCGLDPVGGLRAPPHRADLRDRADVAVAEKAALAERRDDALAYTAILDQGSRRETTEADETGIERPRT